MAYLATKLKGVDVMSNKSIFSKCMDLELYSFLVHTFNNNGIYPFDLPEPGSFTVEQFYTMLTKPESLSTEQFRTIALFTMANDFECDAVKKEIVRRVKQSPDVFLEVAGTYSADAELSSILIDSLLLLERDSVEEYAIALIPFKELERDCKGIVLRFMQKFTDYAIPVIGNEALYDWIAGYNNKRFVVVDLFQALHKAIGDLISDNSSSAAILSDYGFTWLDVCKIVYCVRKKLYSHRRGGKNAKSKEVLLEAFADCTRPWTKEDKELLSSMGGEIAQISNVKNYEWYYKKNGFDGFENAFSINFADNLAVRRRRKILKENEFNRIVAMSDLNQEQLEKLNLTFNVWDADCIELYKKVGGPHDAAYEEEVIFENLLLLEEKYGTVSAPVNFLIDSNHLFKLSEEEFALVEKNLRERFSERYSRVVNMHVANNGTELNEQQMTFLNLAEHFNMDVLKKYGVEAFTSLDENLLEYGQVALATITGADLSAIAPSDYGYLEEYLCKNYQNVESYTKAIKEFVKYFDAEEGEVIEESVEQKKTVDKVTNAINAITRSDSYYSGILSVIKEDVVFLVYHLERFKEICDILYDILSLRCDGKYRNAIGKVLHDFLCGKDLITILNEIKGIESITGNCAYCEEWLQVVQKPIESLTTLDGLSVNSGEIDGVQCILCDKGIIATQPLTKGIPCIVPDDEGEEISVFVGVPYNCIWVPGTDLTLFYDSVVTFKAIVY